MLGGLFLTPSFYIESLDHAAFRTGKEEMRQFSVDVNIRARRAGFRVR